MLVAKLMPVPGKWRQMKQNGKSRGSLDQRPDRGTGETKDEISFPVTRYGTILDRGRTLTDEDLRGHKRLATTA
jgi:hypothetical protein